MPTEAKDKHVVSQSEKERFEVARKDFDRLMRDVKPFIKKRKIKIYSTSGEWTTTSQAQREK